MADCLFCKILDGDIPSTKVYEDDKVYAFLDIHPNNPGHTLVIPKQHSETFLDATQEDLLAILEVAQKIGKAMVEGLNAQGLNVRINTNKAGGQEIFHTHFHVIPRWSGDGLAPWPNRDYEEGDDQKYAQKLRDAIDA